MKPLVFSDVLALLEPHAARLTFAPPVKKSDLAKLEKAVGSLPDDVRAWFSWHDGQREQKSFHGDDAFTALSAAKALAEWTFLNEEGHAPWDKTWRSSRTAAVIKGFPWLGLTVKVKEGAGWVNASDSPDVLFPRLRARLTKGEKKFYTDQEVFNDPADFYGGLEESRVTIGRA